MPLYTSLIFFVSSALFLALSVYAYRRPDVPGCRTFAWMMLACAWWVFCYPMDMTSATAEEKFLWSRLKYLGSTPANFLWLALVVELTGHKHWLRTWWYQLTWIPAVVLMLAVFTNDYHEWFWQYVEIKPGETHSGRTKGPGFQFYVLCTTLLALTSLTLIVLHSIKTVSFYRRRNAWLVLSFLCPYAGFWFDMDQAIPLLVDLDPVPVMLVPSSLFMAIATFRYKAMDIVPLAQKMVFDNVHSAVVVIDPAKQVVATNKYAKNMWPENSQGELELKETIQELAQSGLAHHAEIELQVPSSERWYLVIVSQLADEREGQLGHSLVFVDITERKQKEIERSQLMDARASFFASVSHELRSPLHAITGLLDMTMASDLSEKQRRQLEDAKASTNMLLALINNVLDESRLQADKMPLEHVPMDLQAITHQLQAVHTYSASKKGLQLRFSVDNHDKAMLGDPLRLTQVLTNLIVNAIKFSEAGHIDVDISIRRDSANQQEVGFSVTDTGIGISPKDTALLFQPFQQGDQSTARGFGGTGLGLAISQALVRRMGGEIAVQSKEGQGSKFHFTLVFETTELSAAKRSELTPARDLRAYNVLVVDDSEINLEVMSVMLERTGVRWTTAKDGGDALRCVARARYNLVLLDVHMPDMSGLEVVKAIKESAYYKHVPVIAMSASVLPEDRQRASNAGFDGFLDKPFTFDDLVDVLHQYLLPDQAQPQMDHNTQPVALQVVDSAKGVAAFDGNKTRYMELLSSLADECDRQLETLHACDDHEEQHVVLHQLAGAAKLLSALSLAEVAAQAEAMMSRKPSSQQIDERLSQLREESAKLRRWVATQH